MTETFSLAVQYNNQLQHFDAILRRLGYGFHIEVPVKDAIIAFEPDEEKNFRAVLKTEGRQLPDPGLIAAIAGSLQQLFADNNIADP